MVGRKPREGQGQREGTGRKPREEQGQREEGRKEAKRRTRAERGG